MARVLDLRAAALGDRVQHEFLVLDREERRQASGDPFVILTLGNASGRIATAPVWSNQLDWIGGAEPGRVVQVIGELAAFQRRRQLRITGPLRVLPEESVSAESFLPRITMPTEQLWDWVDRTRAEMRSVPLRRAVDTFFGDDAFRVEFERVPASLSKHHAVVGGLLLHVTEVASIARTAARVLKGNIDLVTAGALLHDVGKVRAYVVHPIGFSWSATGELLGTRALTQAMLAERLAGLVPEVLQETQVAELVHMAAVAHDGESGGAQTLEAEIVQDADRVAARGTVLGAAPADDDWVSRGEWAPSPTHDATRESTRESMRVWRRPHTWE